jgi:hypothetical protein
MRKLVEKQFVLLIIDGFAIMLIYTQIIGNYRP